MKSVDEDLQKCGHMGSNYSSSFNTTLEVNHPMFINMTAASRPSQSQPPLMGKIKKRRVGDTETDDSKRVKKEKPNKPSPLQAILMPVAGKTTKDIIEASNANLEKIQLSIQQDHTGKIPNGMTKYSRFCFKFLVREPCESKSCGNHLCLNAPISAFLSQMGFKSE